MIFDSSDNSTSTHALCCNSGARTSTLNWDMAGKRRAEECLECGISSVAIEAVEEWHNGLALDRQLS